MGLWEGWRARFAVRAAVAFVSLAVMPSSAGAEDAAANARLERAVERVAVARAILGAARHLDESRCQALLDEFADASGRPLRAALAAHDLTASAYLRRVFFYDAHPSLCRKSNLALTQPGSRAVFVCGSRFVREMQHNSRHAEAAIIHETLHSLGLGENPPSSDQITSRVRSECGHGGKVDGPRP